MQPGEVVWKCLSRDQPQTKKLHFSEDRRCAELVQIRRSSEIAATTAEEEWLQSVSCHNCFPGQMHSIRLHSQRRKVSCVPNKLSPGTLRRGEGGRSRVRLIRVPEQRSGKSVLTTQQQSPSLFQARPPSRSPKSVNWEARLVPAELGCCGNAGHDTGLLDLKDVQRLNSIRVKSNRPGPLDASGGRGLGNHDGDANNLRTKPTPSLPKIA